MHLNILILCVWQLCEITVCLYILLCWREPCFIQEHYYKSFVFLLWFHGKLWYLCHRVISEGFRSACCSQLESLKEKENWQLWLPVKKLYWFEIKWQLQPIESLHIDKRFVKVGSCICNPNISSPAVLYTCVATGVMIVSTCNFAGSYPLPHLLPVLWIEKWI